MAGNVSEWVADVFRPLTNNEVSDMNYFRGNLFQTYITEDGQASVNNDVVNYDDNPNGRTVYNQLPGSIQKENIVPNDFDSEFTSEELLNSNGLVANNLAYADGDKLFQRDDEEMYTDAFDETRREKKTSHTCIQYNTSHQRCILERPCLLARPSTAPIYARIFGCRLYRFPMCNVLFGKHK